LRWEAMLHDRQIASRPALALTVAIGGALRGDGETALRWAEVGERLLARAPAAQLPSLRAAAAVIRAMLATGSVAAMTDATARALAVAPEDSPWRATACLLAGAGHHIAGARAQARRELEEGAARAAVCAPAVRATCLAQLALMALEDEDWEHAGELCDRAREIAAHVDAEALRGCALVLAAAALVGAQRGDAGLARDDVLEARRRLAVFAERWPWYDAEARVALARAELRLSDASGARTLLTEASRALRAVPDAPVLRGWIDDAWERADTFAVEAFAGPATLTTAELRVLRFLPSHMSFRELATRLHVSTNTVKTQAHAVYRKLDASSRSEAVARARDVGLIDV
jgi:LuxR family maltose regulon positive regulatory protein